MRDGIQVRVLQARCIVPRNTLLRHSVLKLGLPLRLVSEPAIGVPHQL